MKKKLIVGLSMGIIILSVFTLVVILSLPKSKNNLPLDKPSQEAHTHTWSEWISSKEATCDTKGLKTRSCDCGEKEDILIAALGHNLGEWIVINEALCEIDGIKERYCSECSFNETQSIDAITHTEGEWIVKNNEKHFLCIHCGISLRIEQLYTSEGLNIKSGIVISLNNCPDTEIVIPSQFDNVSVITIAEQAFEYENIKSIILPDTIITIEENAFYQCSGLETVHLGNSISTIEKRAFSRCSSINSIYLPNSLITLGVASFEYCTNLQTVYMGNSIDKLEMKAFQYCKNLTDIYFNGTIDEWNAIEKDKEWDLGISDYTVHCTDGNVEK